MPKKEEKIKKSGEGKKTVLEDNSSNSEESRGGETLKGNELKEKEENEIRQFTRELMNSLLEGKQYFENRSVRSFSDKNNLLFLTEEKLNEIVGTKREFLKDGVLSISFKRSVAVFFDELLKFCEENKNKSNFNLLLENLHQQFFSIFPSLDSFMFFKDIFNTAARATRIPEIQAVFGLELVGNLAYNLQADHSLSAKKKILNQIRKSSQAEKLDKIHLLEVLCAEAMSQGEYRVEKMIMDILDETRKTEKSAFIKYYVDITKNRIIEEEQNPTVSAFIKNVDNPGNARLYEFLSPKELEEAERLESIIYPIDVELKEGRRILRLAEDLLSIVDHSGRPILYSNFNTRLEKEKLIGTKISISSLREVLAVLKKCENGDSTINPEIFFRFVNENIIKPFNNLQENNFQKNGELFSKMSNALDSSEWARYLELTYFLNGVKHQVEEFYQKRGAEIQHNKEEKNNEFQDYFRDNIEDILEQVNDEHLFKLYEEMQRAEEHGEMDHAYDIADNIVRHLGISSGRETLFEGFSQESVVKSKGAQRLIDKYEALNKFDESNYENLSLEVEEFQKKLWDKYSAELDEYGLLREKILEFENQIVADFQNEFKRIDKIIRNNLISLEFTRFEDIIKKEGIVVINDFYELNLLFQHLHRPSMRALIDQRMRIKLKEIPFRYQIYFLQFLCENDEAGIDRISNFIDHGQDEVAKLNRIKTFFSLEFGQELSKKIFAISENLDPKQADMVFAKYAEIVDLAYATEKELMESIMDAEKPKIVDPQIISRDILSRGKDILVAFANDAQVASENEKKLSTDDIMSKLQDYHRDLVFQAATIKEGKKYGLGFTDFRGAKFRVMTAREVAESPRLRSRMSEYYRRNWQRRPAIQAKALENFEIKINQRRDDIIFFVFDRGGELAAFSGAERISPGRTHFFGFNVNPAMQGSKIGWDMKEASVRFFDEERKMDNDPIIKLFGTGNDIEIECDPVDPKSTPVYVEKDGYVITGISFDFGEDPIFKAVREISPQTYYFRGKPKDEVIKYYIENNMGNKFNEDDELIVLKFEPGSEEMKKLTDKLLNREHYRITSYFFAEDRKVVYCAFERGCNSS